MLVPEGKMIFADMTVRENLLMGGYHNPDRDLQLEIVLDRFPRLRERLHQLGGTLSGGEQQMLALGRALMARPRLLLLDEPSMGLAPLLVKEVFAEIRKMRDLGVTVLLVEQNAIATLQIADRAYVMETGEIILEGEAGDLMHNPEVKRAYLGKGGRRGWMNSDSMSIFDRRYEMMPRAELEQLQLERLQALLARLKRNVRRYREKLGDLRARIAGRPGAAPVHDAGGHGGELPLRHVRLPAARGHPPALHRGPGRQAAGDRPHPQRPGPVGPAGRAPARGQRRHRQRRHPDLPRRLASTPGAAGYVLGAELIEASVIAEDPLHIDYQLAMLQNYRPTILITTPTNALDLMRTIEQRRIDPQSLHLRTVLLSRPVDKETREQLARGALRRRALQLRPRRDPRPRPLRRMRSRPVPRPRGPVPGGGRATANWSSPRLPAKPCRCCATARAIAAELSRDKCACGRTGVLLQPGARLDRRYQVNETTFYEAQVAEVLAQTPAAGLRFQLETSERRLHVALEMSENLFAGTLTAAQDPKRDIESEFLSRLGVDAEVRWIEPRLETQFTIRNWVDGGRTLMQ